MQEERLLFRLVDALNRQGYNSHRWAFTKLLSAIAHVGGPDVLDYVSQPTTLRWLINPLPWSNSLRTATILEALELLLRHGKNSSGQREGPYNDVADRLCAIQGASGMVAAALHTLGSSIGESYPLVCCYYREHVSEQFALIPDR